MQLFLFLPYKTLCASGPYHDVTSTLERSILADLFVSNAPMDW